MGRFTIKTYKDSYLYNFKISDKDTTDPGKKNSAAIREYILSAHRIEDKKSDAFRGIVEELKRQQRSSILVTVLLMDDVKICLGNTELPKAFKVLDVKDSKSGGKNKIFIDATGLIEFKQGYYYCKRIDILCSYLMDALVCLLYRLRPEKLLTNSSITIPTVDCYVSMFTYILDYLRVTGYAENKTKISYFVGLFFLENMMGMEHGDYAKQLAAKNAGISLSEVKNYDLYLDEGCFDNIKTFFDWLVNVFRLKGLTLAVFIAKWAYNFGTGTQYATELFSCFTSVVLNAFSGSYITNQKQIERCCGSTNLVKVWNAVEKAGVDCFDRRGFMSESDLSIYEVHDRNTSALSEAVKMRSEGTETITPEDFASIDSLSEKCDNIIKFYKESKQESKLSDVAENAIGAGLAAGYFGSINLIKGLEPTYENGALTMVAKKFKNQISDRQRYNIECTVNRDIGAMMETARDVECDKETSSKVSTIVSEFREFQKYI